MDLKEFRDNLRLQVKKLDNSGLAAWIRGKAAMLSDQDLIALAQNEIVPAHGYHLPNSETWPIPLIKTGDSDDQKQYLMLPISLAESIPIELDAGTEHIGSVEIDTALPVGANTIGNVRLQDGNGLTLADVFTVGGSHALEIYIRGAAAAIGVNVAGVVNTNIVTIGWNQILKPDSRTYKEGANAFHYRWALGGAQVNTQLFNRLANTPTAQFNGCNYMAIHSCYVSMDIAPGHGAVESFLIDDETGWTHIGTDFLNEYSPRTAYRTPAQRLYLASIENGQNNQLRYSSTYAGNHYIEVTGWVE